MKYIKYTDSPKVEDTIGFVLEAYGDDGILKNPYMIDKVTVYRIEHQISNNDRVLEKKSFNPELLKMHNELQMTVMDDPTEENKEQLKKLTFKLHETADITNIHYSNARIVMQTISPLWATDKKTQHVVNVIENNKKIEGKFLFIWTAKGMREGTYLIRWEWKNTASGPMKTAEKLFMLYPAEEKLNSIYRNFVPREKYNFLFDKYIPKMYRVKTTPNDRTPDVVGRFNKSIGQVLLELDDLAVGLVDLLDPMFIPEGFLPVIANMFNLELKTNRPAAWRNQIKNAIPLYKKKGTLEGLKQALDKAGIRILKLTNLWQVVSPYTWVDGFVIERDILGNEVIGQLSKRPTKDSDLEIYLKSAETQDYFKLPGNVVYLQDILLPEPRVSVIWNGNAHSPPIELFKGDVIRIKFNYKKIPEDAIAIEQYIDKLPLSDQRDETKIKYPIKNWNVKLIEDGDPLFDLVIPNRHTFHNPVTYGKTRTTFLYSEKAFNMDTYNGSLYNSNNPCDMDKDFIDPCGGGQGSKFNVHLEFKNIDDDIINEARDIITDYSPFHAILHNMKISSQITDFVLPPLETIKSKIKTKPAGENVKFSEAIYCKIKYKNGNIEAGRIV